MPNSLSFMAGEHMICIFHVATKSQCWCLTYDIKYNSVGGGACRIKATSVFYHITAAYCVKKFFPKRTVNNHNKTQVSEKSQCICARRTLHCAGSREVPYKATLDGMCDLLPHTPSNPGLSANWVYTVIVTSAPTYILLLTGGQGLCTHLV